MSAPNQTQVLVECQAAGCSSVLQVAVPSTHRQGDGEVLVRCGTCHKLLRVQLPQELLQPVLPATHQPQAQSALPPYLPPPSQHQQDQARSTGGGAVRRRRSSSITPYHEFVSQEMKRLKATHPDLDQTTAFQVAASSWVTSGAKAAADQAQQQQQQPAGQAQAHPGMMSAQDSPSSSSGSLGTQPRQPAEGGPQLGAPGLVSSELPPPPLPAAAVDQPLLQSWSLAAQVAAAARPVLPAGAAEVAPVAEQQGGTAPDDLDTQVTPATAAAAAAKAAAMAPPPARGTSDGSDAAASSQEAVPVTTAGTAAATAAGHPWPPTPGSAGRAAAPSPPPAAAAVRAAGDVSSGQAQATPAAAVRTLAETWEALCRQHGSPMDLLPQPAASTLQAPASAAVRDAASTSAAAPAAAALSADKQGVGPCLSAAKGNTPAVVLGSLAAAAHAQQQPQQQKLPAAPTPAPGCATRVGGPTLQAITPGRDPAAAAAAAAAPTIPAALPSEGSSLASWTSSVGAAGPAAADLGLLASPGAAGSAAASAITSSSLLQAGGGSTIMRHNSAPITTGFPPLPSGQQQGKAAGYSITTPGPVTPARQ